MSRRTASNLVRIGLDADLITGAKTGIGRYVFELLKALEIQLPNAEFYLYSQFPVAMPSNSGRWIARVDPHANRIKHIAWLKLRCGAMCKRDGVDVFWATATMFPALAESVRRVSTVYDLNHKIVPETMPVATLWAYRLFFARDVRSADAVTAISQGTSDKLKQYVGRSADVIVHPAADAALARAADADIARVRAKYAIFSPYLLAVATLEPRKNLGLLIDVFTSLKQGNSLPHNYELLLVGGKGWKDSELSRKIEAGRALGVRTLGFLPDEDLTPFYSGCEAFLFPSLYEGFGMPVLEARACGARVLATDIPEIREAGGPDTHYCKPDFASLRGGILSVLGSPVRRSADQLTTWHEAAKVFAPVLLGHKSVLQPEGQKVTCPR